MKTLTTTLLLSLIASGAILGCDEMIQNTETEEHGECDWVLTPFDFDENPGDGISGIQSHFFNCIVQTSGMTEEEKDIMQECLSLCGENLLCGPEEIDDARMIENIEYCTNHPSAGYRNWIENIREIQNRLNDLHERQFE